MSSPEKYLPFNPKIEITQKMLGLIYRQLVILKEAKKIAKRVKKQEKKVRKDVKKHLKRGMEPGAILAVTKETLLEERKKIGARFVNRKDDTD